MQVKIQCLHCARAAVTGWLDVYESVHGDYVQRADDLLHGQASHSTLHHGMKTDFSDTKLCETSLVLRCKQVKQQELFNI